MTNTGQRELEMEKKRQLINSAVKLAFDPNTSKRHAMQYIVVAMELHATNDELRSHMYNQLVCGPIQQTTK